MAALEAERTAGEQQRLIQQARHRERNQAVREVIANWKQIRSRNPDHPQDQEVRWLKAIENDCRQVEEEPIKLELYWFPRAPQ